MTRQFDLAVVGSGVAGDSVARRCRAAGWEVAVIDSRPFGGTCALRGCDAKKVMLGVASAVDAARRLAGKGMSADARLDWRDLVHFKRSFTDPVPEEREAAYRDLGIEAIDGRARFTGPGTLEVAGERLEARRVHIAAGARPADLPVDGAEHLTTSDEFLDLDELPQRVVLLGSGFISFELAHLARVAGAEVTMLDMQEQPLAGFDPDLVDILAERTRAMGIELRLETLVESIERRGRNLVVRASAGEKRVVIKADMVVHGAGRVPDIDDLDLAEGGVEFDESGVMVNAYMQSVSNPAVYAAGDAAWGARQLTPVASFEARVAAANLLEGNHRSIAYPPIPRAVFALPPLAAVGLEEWEARQEGLDFETHFERTSSWYSSRRLAQPDSGYKVLREKGSGRILGAHLLGHGADELINLFAAAIRGGLSARDLKRSIFTYPSLGSDLQSMV